MSLFLHKHWKKTVLALTAAFWASCGDDSTSSTQVEIVPDSSDAIASSDAVLPESSSSSNPKDTLKLASDTTITCRDSVTWTTFKFYTDTGDCKTCKYWRYCEGSSLHLRDEKTKELAYCHVKRLEDAGA
ncbi:hypothetical protein [Fibrobacter sp.]|uniref:hypothetical protein n=1 Tax=Fibrobacter sp. TaxID=35828 RepID=UPI00388F72F7